MSRDQTVLREIYQQSRMRKNLLIWKKGEELDMVDTKIRKKKGMQKEELLTSLFYDSYGMQNRKPKR